MAFVPMAMAAFQAVGQIYGAQQAAGQASAAAKGAMQNAGITRAQSSANEDTMRRQQATMLGNMRARSAESGFDPGSGSGAALLSQAAGETELDILTRRYESELRALSFENEARSARAAGRAAKTSGYLSAFGTLAGSLGSTLAQPRIGPLAPVETRIPKPVG